MPCEQKGTVPLSPDGSRNGSTADEHSYEEIYSVACAILAGRERTRWHPDQYLHLANGIAEVFCRRENVPQGPQPYPGQNLSLENHDVYFFHDVSSYEATITKEVPTIDPVTLLYLKEAMQAFRSGCPLSATALLGVAAEHTLLLLLETIEANLAHATTYRTVRKESRLLPKINKFRSILDKSLSKDRRGLSPFAMPGEQKGTVPLSADGSRIGSRHVADLPPDVLEDLDTNFAGIQAIIRNFKNDAGHPTGKIVAREQAYVLLNAVIPYLKKMHQLIDHFAKA
jgi:hypothetical protein